MGPEMKLIKVFLVILIVLGVLLGLAWQFMLKDSVAQARLAAAYTAKDYCSCRFVGERSPALCRASFTDDISAVSFHEGGTPGAERIEASLLWGMVSAEALHRPGFGCALVAD